MYIRIYNTYVHSYPHMDELVLYVLHQMRGQQCKTEHTYVRTYTRACTKLTRTYIRTYTRARTKLTRTYIRTYVCTPYKMTAEWDTIFTLRLAVCVVHIHTHTAGPLAAQHNYNEGTMDVTTNIQTHSDSVTNKCWTVKLKVHKYLWTICICYTTYIIYVSLYIYIHKHMLIHYFDI